MSGIAYRLAGGVNAANSFIGLIINNVVIGYIAYSGVYQWLTAKAFQKAYALLAIPGVIFVPWLVCIVVALPLGYVHYVLTGHYDRETARREYAVLRFVSMSERLRGARPSNDEIDQLTNEHRSGRETVILGKALVVVALNVVALGVGGVTSYWDSQAHQNGATRRFTVTDPDGKPFVIKGPDGATQEEAQEMVAPLLEAEKRAKERR